MKEFLKSVKIWQSSCRQWCGLRPSVLGQDRSKTKKSVLVLVLQVWCCAVKDDLVTLVVIMILKDTATFQVLFIVYSVLGTALLWISTTAFTYLKVKSDKCLCLLPVVLVLRIWSCLHHCSQQQNFSWCSFGGHMLNKSSADWQIDKRCHLLLVAFTTHNIPAA